MFSFKHYYSRKIEINGEVFLTSLEDDNLKSYVRIINIYIMLKVLFLGVLLVSTFESPTLPFHSVELHGNFSLGYYYANIYLGTPPQKQSFIVDTGSTIFAIPCSMCTSCGLRHLNPKFDVARSNTSKLLDCESGKGFCSDCTNKPSNQSCSFSMKYAEGSSLNGVMVQDMVLISDKIQSNQTKNSNPNSNPSTLTDAKEQNPLKQLKQQQEEFSNEAVRAVFGCVTKQTHLFLNQKADGILGLGPQQISNILTKIRDEHGPSTNQELTFSICYADNGGLFSIGGQDPTIKRSNQVVLKYRSDHKHYSLSIDDVLVGDKPLNLSTLQIFSGQGIIIDSGATYTYFPQDHFRYVTGIINQTCKDLNCTSFSGQESLCYHFPTQSIQPNATLMSFQEQINKFPTIDIRLNSKKVSWPAKDYFLVRNEQKRQVCLGILPLNRWILGSTWMMNRDISFNLDRKQIKISDSFCSSNQNYIAPKFHKMYGHDRPPLTELFMQIPHRTLMALLMVLGIIVVIAVIAFGTILSMRRQNSSMGAQQNNVESIQMIQEHSQNLQSPE